MAWELAMPRKPSFAQAAPLRRSLAGLMGAAWGHRAEAVKDPEDPERELSVSSTRSDVSDLSLPSDDSAAGEPAELPYFEDEAVHARWEALLGAGSEPWRLPADDLRALIVRGTPMKHRLALWPRWFALPPGSIESVEELQGRASSAAAAQIDLDVPRTHPHWPLAVGQRGELARVLRACAARRPEVGYCQGMGHMTAVLVALGFDEDTALRGMCSLLESSMKGYHDESLSGWRRDARVLERLAARALPPDALRRLRVLDVPMEVLASDHFLSLGSRTWPLEAVLRLWDLVLLDGPVALFSSFLATLDAFLPSEEEVAQLLDSMHSECKLWREERRKSARELLEPVELFRERVQQGLTAAPEQVLQRTRDIMEMISGSVLDELRLGL